MLIFFSGLFEFQNILARRILVLCRRLIMANISWLERRTGYSLLLLVVIGLSTLPSASCQFCNTDISKFILGS